MAEVVHYALMAQGIVLALMLIPAFGRRTDVSTLLIVGGLGTYAAISFVWGAWAVFEWTHVSAVLTWSLLITLLFATLLPFFLMMPRRSLRRRDVPVLVIAAAALVGTLVSIMTAPSWYTDGDLFSTAATEYIFGLLFLVLFVPLVVLAVRWVRMPAGSGRAQIGHVLPGLMLTNLNDGLGLLRPAGFDLPGGFLVAPSSDPVLVATSFLRFFIIGGLIGVAANRYRKDRSADSGLILLWGVAAIPLAFISMRLIEVHHIVDGLALALIYYGVARFRVIEVDLGRYVSAGKSLAATTAIVIVFIVQQAVEQSAGTFFGVVGGAVAAGVGLAFLAPLQRQLEGRRPAAESPGTAFDAHRRIEVYRAALAAVWDPAGEISSRDEAMLQRMRANLLLTDADHRAILDHLRTPPGRSDAVAT